MEKLKCFNKSLEAFKKASRGNNKGVSLMSLIITIIVIVILAGIILNSFFGESQDKATSARVLNEFIEVENAVSQRGKEHKLDDLIYPYEGTPLSNENSMTINDKTYGNGYYYLMRDDLAKLGITGTIKSYIVNYDTGEVILEEPYVIAKRTIYSKSELIDVETENAVTGEADYDERKGVNKPVLYSGMIPVKQSGGVWVVTDAQDDEWYDYAINGNGPIRYANVMLLDDISLSSDGNYYSNTRVRGMNLAQMKGMTVVDQGSMFIWIPRYTYKENGSSTEVVYSRLYTDYTLNGFIKSPAFYNGEYTGSNPDNPNAGFIAGGKELSGIWISKYEARYGD